MFFGKRNSEEKKHKQIKAYFTVSKPTRRSRTDPQWISEARLTGLIKFSDLTYKKGRFFRKGRFEIPHDAFEKAKALRKEKMKKWGISERDVSSKPSSQQIDKWIQEDISKIKQEALEHCGIHEIMKNDRASMQPIITPIINPTVRIPKDDIVFVIDQEDSISRCSCYDIMILILGESRLTVYRGEYNFLRSKRYHVNDQQWWYSEVKSIGVTEISSSKENYSLPDGETITDGSILQLNLGMQKIEMFLKGDIQKRNFLEQEENEPTSQNVVQRMSVRTATIHAIRDQIDERKNDIGNLRKEIVKNLLNDNHI